MGNELQAFQDAVEGGDEEPDEKLADLLDSLVEQEHTIFGVLQEEEDDRRADAVVELIKSQLPDDDAAGGSGDEDEDEDGGVDGEADGGAGDKR